LIVEQAERHWYIEHLKPGMTAFDVGANVGLTAFLFSTLVGSSGRVYAFEPGTSSFQKLAAAVALPQFANIRAAQVALSDRTGQQELFVYDDAHSSWNSLVRRPPELLGLAPTRTKSVDTSTLDDFCRVHQIARIDLLKIDVEGAELSVLRGARQLFRERSIGRCIFEIGQTTFDAGTTPKELCRFLDDLGYRSKPVIGSPWALSARMTRERVPFLMVVAEPR
jgi:FkbM family methyltransferase